MAGVAAGPRHRARSGREDHRLDPPGARLDRHRVADPGDPKRVLDVLGVHVEPVGQDDDVLLAPVEVEAALASSCPRSPDLYQPSSVKAAAVASGLFQ